MSPIEEQIIETWLINHRTNLMILENLTEEALLLTTSKRGGGSVGHQFAHMYNVRIWKIENINKSLVTDFKTIRKEDTKTLALLKDYHTLSTNLIIDVLKKGIEDHGTIKGNKRGLVPLLGYFIHHEAHHRGNILLTLKLGGFKLSDEVKFGIWEWNKI